jgi:hypothetical protein
VKDPVHGFGSAEQDRADLLAVDGFGYGGAAVADEAGDVFEGDVGVGEQRDEAVQYLLEGLWQSG